jgi:hypothetical protein
MAKLNMINNTRKECEGFIYDFLKEHGNSVTTYSVNMHYIGEECVFINGGKSCVEGLIIGDDDEIYLDLDDYDCPKYGIDSCSNDEIIYIAQYLNANAKEFDEMKK